MAYTPDVDQLSRTGTNNLDEAYCRGKDFGEIFRTAKRIVSDAYDTYSSLLYQQKYTINASNIPNHRLSINLTQMEHCFGLPFPFIYKPGGSIDTDQKGSTDYLNFYLYAAARRKFNIPSANLVQFDPNNREHTELKTQLTASFESMKSSYDQYISLDTSTDPSISADKILRDAKNALKLLISPSNKGGSIKDKVSSIHPLNRYYMLVLEKMLNIYKNLIYTYKNEMFIENSNGTVTIKESTEFDYENQLFIIIADLISTDLTNDRNNDEKIRNILKCFNNSKEFFSYLLTYKNQIAPFLSGDKFEQVIKDYYPTFKNKYYQAMISKFDITNLGNTMDTSLGVLEHIRANKNVLNTMEISEPAIANIMNSNCDKLYSLFEIASGYTNPTLGEYISVVKAYSSIDFNDPNIDMDFMADCKEEIELFINKHSDIYYKYFAISKDINRIVSSPTSKFKNTAGKSKDSVGVANLFIRDTLNGPIKLYENNSYLTPTEDDYEFVFNEVYKVQESIRQNIFYGNLGVLVENIRKKASECGDFNHPDVQKEIAATSDILLKQYGTVFMFNIMLNAQPIYDLLSWEFYSNVLPYDRASIDKIKGLRDLLDIKFTGPITSDNIKDYLKKVWHTVSPNLCRDAISRTILWDKVMLKTDAIKTLDDGLFLTSNVRKAVTKILGQYKYNSATGAFRADFAKSSIRYEDVGYIIEVPTNRTESILFYVRLGPDGVIPEHVLRNIKSSTTDVEMPVYDSGTNSYTIRKIPLGTPSLVGYVNYPDGVTNKTIRKQHIMTKQELPDNDPKTQYIIIAEDKQVGAINSRTKSSIEIDDIINYLRSFKVNGVELFTEQELDFGNSRDVYTRNR